MRIAKAKPEATDRNGTSGIDAFDSSHEARVTFDRFGQIQRLNPAAARLFDHSALSMLGRPLARFIARHDSQAFLHHLLRCRMREKKVETDLHLKSGRGEKIPARLSSISASESADGIRSRYQTMIVDLRAGSRS